jgi:hypothetical protein
VVKKRKNASTLHTFFDNLYNSHRILQCKTIQSNLHRRPHYDTRYRIQYMHTAYCLHASNPATAPNSIFGAVPRWETEKIIYNPAGAVDFFVIRSTQTISGAHPASYSMQTGGSIPEGNAHGALANQ